MYMPGEYHRQSDPDRGKNGGGNRTHVPEKERHSRSSEKRRRRFQTESKDMNRNPSKAQYKAALRTIAAFEAAQPSKAKKAKKAKNTFAADMRSKREQRWSAKPLGGLTSDQRSSIARKLEAKHGGTYSAQQWTKAVAKFKAGGFR